jgi:hypothetical protein
MNTSLVEKEMKKLVSISSDSLYDTLLITLAGVMLIPSTL